MNILTKSQKKNRARNIRRKEKHSERPKNKSLLKESSFDSDTLQLVFNKQIEENALKIIKWYVRWWIFVKITPFMNSHKRNVLRERKQGDVKGVIEKWGKTSLNNIEGEMDDFIIGSGSIAYDLISNKKRYILTTNGSFYELGRHENVFVHTNKEKELCSEKRIMKRIFCNMHVRPCYLFD